jgi:hypothetical protein
MRKLGVLAALLATPSLFLVGVSAAFSQDPFPAFTTSGTRAFNACLYAAWVDDYCRNSVLWFSRSYSESYFACVSANKGGKFPMAGRTWYNTEGYCRVQARGR